MLLNFNFQRHTQVSCLDPLELHGNICSAQFYTVHEEDIWKTCGLECTLPVPTENLKCANVRGFSYCYYVKRCYYFDKNWWTLVFTLSLELYTQYFVSLLAPTSWGKERHEQPEWEFVASISTCATQICLKIVELGGAARELTTK